MSRCTVCGGQALRTALDLGSQPASNRFVAPDSDENERYPLSLGDCADCGTVQLVDRMPVTAIRPRYDWLANNEPEQHLDELVDHLVALPGVTSTTRFLGVTYKDRTTLQRLSQRGFAHVQELDISEFAAPTRPFGLETIQRSLSEPGFGERVIGAHGTINVLLARHIVEHAESAVDFLAGMRSLVGDGYLVLELPDNGRILQSSCHAFIWEEHFTYFTERSFRMLAAFAGAEILRLDRYQYRYEDALVAMLRFTPAAARLLPGPDTTKGHDLCHFAARFVPSRSRWQAEVSQLVAAGHTVAVFGAGHLAVKFINFMELTPWLNSVVDDHPAKGGLQMPGSKLPIVASAAMKARGVDVCISTLSPESEARARGGLGDFFEHGGLFTPAFTMQEE